MNKCNRTWIAFANRKRCRHADVINTLGFISWRMGRARFAIGNIVYLFMSDERYVRFEMIVTAENCKREDKEFWIEKAIKKGLFHTGTSLFLYACIRDYSPQFIASIRL